MIRTRCLTLSMAVILVVMLLDFSAVSVDGLKCYDCDKKDCKTGEKECKACFKGHYETGVNILKTEFDGAGCYGQEECKAGPANADLGVAKYNGEVCCTDFCNGAGQIVAGSLSIFTCIMVLRILKAQ